MNFSFNEKYLKEFINTKLAELSDERVGAYMKGVVIEAANFTLEDTPQWSGHMAANFTIAVDGSFTPGVHLYDPEWRYAISSHGGVDSGEVIGGMGNEMATDISRNRNRWVNDYPFTVDTIVTLSYLNEPSDPYYDRVEQGIGLREINKPGHAMERAEHYVKLKSNIRINTPLKNPARI